MKKRHGNKIKLKQENDPKTPILYLKVVSTFLQHYDDLYEPDAIFHWIHPDCLCVIDDWGSVMRHEMMQKFGYGSRREELEEQCTYQFIEPGGHRGTILISFNDVTLMNSRIQLHFQGYTNGKASNFTSIRLKPLLSACLGEDNYQYDPTTCTYTNTTALDEYIVAFRKEPYFSTVTTQVTRRTYYS